MTHHHRSGSLRQSNKKHKGEKKSLKGVEKSSKAGKNNRILSKKERRLQAKQLRDNKTRILKLINADRGQQAPINVAVIALADSIDAGLAIQLLTATDTKVVKDSFCSSTNRHIQHFTFQRFKSRVSFLTCEYKNIFSCIDLVNSADWLVFLTPSEVSTLESSTYVDQLLSAIYSQGLPPTMFAVMSNMCDLKDLRGFINLKFSLPEDRVRRLNSIDDALVVMRHICETKNPTKHQRDKEAVHAGQSAVCQTAARLRSHLLCETIEPVLEETTDRLLLRVQGVLKGAPMVLTESMKGETIELDSVGPYVYLPGWGDLKLDGASWKIKANEQNITTWTRRANWDLLEAQQEQERQQEMMQADEQDLPSSDDDEDDDDVDDDDDGSCEENGDEASSNDQMEAENGDDDEAVSVSSLPSDLSAEERMNEIRRRRLKNSSKSSDETGSSTSWATRSARTLASTVNTSFSEAQLMKFRDARSETMFPDEVETPRNLSAKARFSKFRGLSRFRGTEWPLDQDPALPLEYCKTFRFHSYPRNRRTINKFIMKRYRMVFENSQSSVKVCGEEGYILPGSIVEFTLGPVDQELCQAIVKTHTGLQSRPLVLWSLLPHERRLSIVHCNMRRVNAAMNAVAEMQDIAKKANSINARCRNMNDLSVELGEEACTPAVKTLDLMEQEFKSDPTRLVMEAEPIKSKEPMLFQIGVRRFIACPIYSEVLLTNADREKTKYERFFPASGCNTMASMYAPVMYAPQHVLQFRIRSLEDEDGNLSSPYVGELVATGSLASVNPSRLIIKRIVLSGHPYKLNKRSAVVRFMFFSSEDIDYFKPVRLHTKYGSIGHIRQPVGTHGYMKCVFDKQLHSADVVLMSLYKRQLPKLTYDPRIALVPSEEQAMEMLAQQSTGGAPPSLLSGMQLSQGVSFKPQRQQISSMEADDDMAVFD